MVAEAVWNVLEEGKEFYFVGYQMERKAYMINMKLWDYLLLVWAALDPSSGIFWWKYSQNLNGRSYLLGVLSTKG